MIYLRLLQFLITTIFIVAFYFVWIWLGDSYKRFRKLLWTSTFLTFDLLLFGSFTRLTDSGLGCPDWPGCYGAISPFFSRNEIRIAEKLMPTGPVTILKAWIEMLHRYFALALIMLIILQFAYIIIRRKKSNHISIFWPISLLFLISIQSIFGAWTVTYKLQPAIVTIHLLLGMMLFGVLGRFSYSQTPFKTPMHPKIGFYSLPIRFGLLLLFIQIALGGWVSSNYAVLSCIDFPLCNGKWIPQMDFQNGFHIWRSLGKVTGNQLITPDALVAIHWTHRAFAAILGIYLIFLALRLRSFYCLRYPSSMLLIIIFVQFLTGISNILLRWPLLNAIAHNAGAALLLLNLIALDHVAYLSRYKPTIAL